MAAGGAPHAPLWREEREQSGPTPSRVETQPSYSPTPTRKARVASCGSGSCGGASRTCRRTFGDRSPQCRHARPGQLSPGLLGDEGPTAMPQPPQQQGANGSSPPWRAPPPGSHLREIQVENARRCPLDFTALPLRAPTCAGARLGAAKKGAVMQPATRHYRCATGCVNKKRGPTPSRAPQHLTTHKVHASLGPKNMQNEFRAHAHATNSVCSSAVRLWHAS